MFCSSCRRETTRKARFCSSCGGPFESEKGSQPSEIKAKKQMPNQPEVSPNAAFAILGALLAVLTLIALGASLSTGPQQTTAINGAVGSQTAENSDFETMPRKQLCTEYPSMAQRLGKSCKRFEQDSNAATSGTNNPPVEQDESESSSKSGQPDGEIHYFRDIDDYKGAVIDDCIAYQIDFDGPSHYSSLIKNEGLKFRRYMTTKFQSASFARIYQKQSKTLHETGFVDYEENLTQLTVVCYKEADFILEGYN